jgi:O-antigen ligase
MAGGLVATQSRGALLAVACASLLVPWRKYVQFVIPLVAGASLGIAAVAVSPVSRSVPWLGGALAAAVAIAVWDGRGMPRARSGTRTRVVLSIAVLGGLIAGALLVHHEIGLRVLAPSNQDRSVEWSTALHQWASATLSGVGPDRELVFHAADGTSAAFAHNEYLQLGADSGVIGIALLGLVALSLGRVLRRYDALSSCALATAVCLGVAGMFDFDWHLPFVGLVGGWCGGLAARRESR